MVGYGLDVAAGFKDCLEEGLKVALLFFLLEPFVVPTSTWYEEVVDFLSVQATLYHGRSTTSWWQRMVVHQRFYGYNRK